MSIKLFNCFHVKFSHQFVLQCSCRSNAMVNHLQAELYRMSFMYQCSDISSHQWCLTITLIISDYLQPSYLDIAEQVPLLMAVQGFYQGHVKIHQPNPLPQHSFPTNATLFVSVRCNHFSVSRPVRILLLQLQVELRGFFLTHNLKQKKNIIKQLLKNHEKQSNT